jgi:hypothetical protein
MVTGEILKAVFPESVAYSPQIGFNIGRAISFAYPVQLVGYVTKVAGNSREGDQQR